MFDNVKFNMYNFIYTINDEYTKPAEHILLLETLFEDYIYGKK
jgi:hypothetical protein